MKDEKRRAIQTTYVPVRTFVHQYFKTEIDFEKSLFGMYRTVVSLYVQNKIQA